MKEVIEIPLWGVTYTDPNRTPDSLELAFMKEVSIHTGFIMDKIHIKKAYRCKYSRQIDAFEFEYDGKDYVLEKDKLKDLA